MMKLESVKKLMILLSLCASSSSSFASLEHKALEDVLLKSAHCQKFKTHVDCKKYNFQVVFNAKSMTFKQLVKTKYSRFDLLTSLRHLSLEKTIFLNRKGSPLNKLQDHVDQIRKLGIDKPTSICLEEVKGFSCSFSSQTSLENGLGVITISEEEMKY